MMRLRDRRVAHWHVYTAPDDRIHAKHRNEQSVQMLTEEVPYKDMTSKKWGPAIWRKLKDGVLDTPGWDRLKITALWDREKYYRLHRKLDDTTDKGRLAMDREMIKESKDVHEVDVQIPEMNLEFQRMIKRFIFGPPLGVMSVARPVAVIFEMDSWDKDALPWQLKVMNCDPAVPVIAIGNSWHIDKVSSALRHDESRGQQMQRRITVYLDDDHCFGGKDEMAMSKELHVLLQTATKAVPQHRPYIALRGVKMITEIYEYFLQLLALPPASIPVMFYTSPARPAIWTPSYTTLPS